MLVMLLLTGCAGPSPEARSTRPSREAVLEMIQNRVESDPQVAGLVVGLVDASGQEVVSYGALPAADGALPPAERVQPGEVLFEVGAVSSTFTGTLLAQAVKRREMGLNDPVAKYLPEDAPAPFYHTQTIALVDLATHTSGLPSAPGDFLPVPADPAQLYDALRGVQLAEPPGKNYTYSNLGMGLLGLALARQAGQDYEALLVARICDPLDMPSTRLTLTDEMRARLAPPHDAQGDPLTGDPLTGGPDAPGLYATAGDLLKYLAVYLEIDNSQAARDLRPAVEQAQAGLRVTSLPFTGAGLGWFVTLSGQGTIIWHTGQTAGYHAFVGFIPEKKLGVVVLANSPADIDDIGRHLLDTTNPLGQHFPGMQIEETR